MITRNTDAGHITSAAPAKPFLPDLCRTLYRHKGKMVLVFSATLALLVSVLLFFPRTYTSEARLFIRLGKESVALDPTATLNEVISVNESRESEINSELEILRSRALLEDVVEQIGADTILSLDKEPNWIDKALTPLKAMSTLLSGEISPAERAIHKLEKSIDISSPVKSSVLLVSCKASHPKKAQRILQTFLDSYLIRHTDANRTAGSFDFFAGQSELLGNQLSQAEAELRDAKNKCGMASIEGQRLNLEDQANEVEIALLANQRELSGSQAKVKALGDILRALPEQELAEESTIPSRAVDEMRNELYKLQIQEKAASARNMPLHPDVIMLRKQLEETRDILASEDSSRNRPTRRLNPVHQAVEIELAEAQAEVAAQQTESELLTQQCEFLQSRIRELNDHETSIRQLSRTVNVLEASYLKCTTSREQSRVDAAMDTGRISNVNIVQAASFVAKPSSPKSFLGLLLALILSASAAVLAALVAEQWNRSLNSPEQIERELGIPVLFSVPRSARSELAKV
jgi:polysaccharide biosynthesis protein PslE